MPCNIPVEPVLRITSLNNCLTTDFRHPYTFSGEFHPFWEMVYALEDGFQAAGSDKVYTMKKGDVIFHKPMEFHRLWSMDKQNIRTFIVGFCAEGSLLSKLEGGAFELSPNQQLQLEALQQYATEQLPPIKSGPVEDHLFPLVKHRESYALQLQTFVDTFQLFLLSFAQASEPLTIKEMADSEDSRVYQATVQLLIEHVNEWITIEEIAHHLHCSQSQIKRTFSKFSDIGIHKYLLKLKVARAIRLLRKGYSCSEVSKQLSFSNQNYFSTMFKRETGFPPSHYNDIS